MDSIASLGPSVVGGLAALTGIALVLRPLLSSSPPKKQRTKIIRKKKPLIHASSDSERRISLAQQLIEEEEKNTKPKRTRKRPSSSSLKASVNAAADPNVVITRGLPDLEVVEPNLATSEPNSNKTVAEENIDDILRLGSLTGAKAKPLQKQKNPNSTKKRAVNGKSSVSNTYTHSESDTTVDRDERKSSYVDSARSSVTDLTIASAVVSNSEKSLSDTSSPRNDKVSSLELSAALNRISVLERDLKAETVKAETFKRSAESFSKELTILKNSTTVMTKMISDNQLGAKDTSGELVLVTQQKINLEIVSKKEKVLLIKENHDSKSEIERLQNESSRISAQITDLEEKLRLTETELSKAIQHAVVVETQSAVLSTQHQDSIEVIQKFKKELDSQNSIIRDLESRTEIIKTLETEISNTKAKFDESTSTLNQYESEITLQKNLIKDLESRTEIINALESEISETKSKYEKSNSTLGQYENEIESLNSTILNLKSRTEVIKNMESEIAETKSKYEKSLITIDEYRSEIDSQNKIIRNFENNAEISKTLESDIKLKYEESVAAMEISQKLLSEAQHELLNQKEKNASLTNEKEKSIEQHAEYTRLLEHALVAQKLLDQTRNELRNYMLIVPTVSDLRILIEELRTSKLEVLQAKSQAQSLVIEKNISEYEKIDINNSVNLKQKINDLSKTVEETNEKLYRQTQELVLSNISISTLENALNVYKGLNSVWNIPSTTVASSVVVKELPIQSPSVEFSIIDCIADQQSIIVSLAQSLEDSYLSKQSSEILPKPKSSPENKQFTSELYQTISGLRSQISTLSISLEQSYEAHEQQQNEINILKSELKTISEQENVLKSEVVEKELELTKILHEKEAIVTESNATLKKELEQSNVAYENREHEIATLTRELKTVSERESEIKSETLKLLKEKEAKEAEARQLLQEKEIIIVESNAAFQTLTFTYNSTMKASQYQLVASTTKNQKLQTDLDTKIAECSALELQLQQQTTELLSLKNKYESIEEKLKSLTEVKEIPTSEPSANEIADLNECIEGQYKLITSLATKLETDKFTTPKKNTVTDLRVDSKVDLTTPSNQSRETELLTSRLQESEIALEMVEEAYRACGRLVSENVRSSMFTQQLETKTEVEESSHNEKLDSYEVENELTLVLEGAIGLKERLVGVSVSLLKAAEDLKVKLAITPDNLTMNGSIRVEQSEDQPVNEEDTIKQLQKLSESIQVAKTEFLRMWKK
ncbi:hypothetical protein HK096_001847 [Nowakowskiella sp. JEL0078]|nr:hypothetical protein HK096_001847 [Nowakowskiella sp. JEL0078]